MLGFPLEDAHDAQLMGSARALAMPLAADTWPPKAVNRSTIRDLRKLSVTGVSAVVYGTAERVSAGVYGIAERDRGEPEMPRELPSVTASSLLVTALTRSVNSLQRWMVDRCRMH